MPFKSLKKFISISILITFISTNSIYASALRVPLAIDSDREDKAIRAFSKAKPIDVFSLFALRPGFKNGVLITGRSREDIEKDIIQNVLGLQILGEKLDDYIKIADLLPSHSAYKAGLYTHGEMRHRPFWENYRVYLLGNVIKDQLMLFALQKAREDDDIKRNIDEENGMIEKYEDKKIIEELETRVAEKIRKLDHDSIIIRLEGIGDHELKEVCGIGRKELYEDRPLAQSSLIKIETERLRKDTSGARREKLKSFKKEEIINQYAEQFHSENIGRVVSAVEAVLNWEPDVLGHSIREDLTNLYALDVVRTVMKAVLMNDPKAPAFNPYAETNAKANEVAVDIAGKEKTNRIPELKYEIERLMKLAIGGGVIDLNSPILRADYKADPDHFIERHFNRAGITEFASKYFKEDFEKFYGEVVELKSKIRLVYFLDNNGEAVFDLMLIQQLMIANPNLSVYVVPKVQTLGNDISYDEVENIIANNKVLFEELNKMHGKRFRIVKDGPQIQGVDGRRISEELAGVLQGNPAEKVIGMFAGQANFETTQGWNIPRYYKLMAKGVGMEMATGLPRKMQAFVFAYIPAGVTVGTGDSYLFRKTDLEKGEEKLYSSRQTLLDFEEAVHSEEYKGRINGYWSEGEVNETIIKDASDSGRTFAEEVFKYDAELYESIIRLGLIERTDKASLRRGLIEEVIWGKNGSKSEFRKDVERFAGIQDLAKAQRIPDKKEAEKRAHEYLCAIAIRTAEEIGKSWKQMDQEEFNKNFGSSQFIVIAGRGTRFSNLIHKGLFIGSQGETNLRLAINGSYKTPSTIPTIFISMHLLRWIVKDEFVPGLVKEVESLGDSDELPKGWEEGILPEDKVDPEKRKKYFTKDALIVLCKPYGPGYYLSKGMELGLLGEEKLLYKTAYKQIVFGEMGSAQDLNKSNASLITYMEAVIGNYLITAGGRRAGHAKKSGFEIAKKGNFFLKNGKLAALTDWEYISEDGKTELEALAVQLKNWLVLPGREQKRLRDKFAIDSEGNILINSNTVVFKNDIIKYFNEYNDRSRWVIDKNTKLPLALVWDFIKLAADTLRQKKFKGQWPLGFVDVGEAPSSLKDMAKQTQFSNQYSAQIIKRLVELLGESSVAKDTNAVIYSGENADFNFSDLHKIFTGTGDNISGDVYLDSKVRIGNGVQLSSGVRLSGEVTIGDGVKISNSVVEGPVKIEAGCSLNNTIVCGGIREVTENITGLMQPERELAEVLSNQPLSRARVELNRAIEEGRHTSVAAALTYILGKDARGAKKAQVLLKYLIRTKGLNDYGKVLRKMIAVSSVFEKQPQLFDLIMGISSRTNPDIAELNHGIILEAIDEQLFDFGRLLGSSKAPELYGRIYKDQWAMGQTKTKDFFDQIFDAPGLDIDKKREIMVELIGRYPIGSSDTKSIYQTTFKKDMIEDIVENWGNESVGKLVNVLIGAEEFDRLSDKSKEDPALAKEELKEDLELVLNNPDYQELLEIFGNVRGLINNFIDIAIKNTNQTFKEVILAKNNPLYHSRNGSEDNVYEKPRILSIMGGTGGTPTLLMENLLSELFGGNVTMVIVGSPHDDGGSSRLAQDELTKAGWGYIPSPGDPMNVLSSLTIKEGDAVKAKREVIRMRFPKELPPGASFRGELLKILRDKTNTLIRKGLADAPVDWLYFVKYTLGVAETLDEALINPGRLALAGGSVGNFIFIGHHIKRGAIIPRGRVPEQVFNNSMEELAQSLGLSNNFLLPSTLDVATLYARLEAFELLMDGKSVKCKVEDENGKKKSAEFLFPHMKAELQAGGEPIITKIGSNTIEFNKDIDNGSLLTCKINGIRARIIEDFGEIISRANSKTTIDLMWKPADEKQEIFKVKQGNFTAYFSIIKGSLHLKLVEAIEKSKDEYIDEIRRDEDVEYDEEFKVGKPEDDLTARVKITRSGKNNYQANVRLDAKGQGTTVYFRGVPVVFRSRLIIEQTNITESVHSSGIIDADFVDRADRDMPSPNQKVLELINNTKEAIVIGPGSLITSTLPVLMVPKIVDAICKRKKEGLPVIFIINPYKDNETVDITIGRLSRIFEKTTGRKIEDLFTHMIINDSTKVPEGMTREEFEKFMHGLSDEELTKNMSKARAASDFSSAAKKPRGPLIITDDELRELLDRVKILVEPLAKAMPQEVRQAGSAGEQKGIGYDTKRLGQCIEYVIVEKQLARIKQSDSYQKLLHGYYQYMDDNGETQYDEKALNYDVRRLLREEGWIFKPGGIMRTPLEVLDEIKKKRKEIKSAYITDNDISKHPPRIIVANLAHTLLEYRPTSAQRNKPVFAVSSKMALGINQYLRSGGILIIQTALNLKEIRQELIRHLEKGLVHRVILAPYAGTVIQGFDINGELKPSPEKDYSSDITKEQEKRWAEICRDAEQTYGLDRYLYGPDGLIDGPVLINNRDRKLINFELDNRTDLPEQVVAELNQRLKKKDRPDLMIPRITKKGVLNDMRDAIIEYLTNRFEKEKLPVIAEKPSGSGAINTRLKYVDRGKVIREILGILNKQQIKDHNPIYEEKDMYILGKGNEVVLKEFPDAQGIYFREESATNIPDNAKVYNGNYGIHGIEQFFIQIYLAKRRIEGSTIKALEALSRAANEDYVKSGVISRRDFIEIRTAQGISERTADREIRNLKKLGIIKQEQADGKYVFNLRLTEGQIGFLPEDIKLDLARGDISGLPEQRVSEIKAAIQKILEVKNEIPGFKEGNDSVFIQQQKALGVGL